MTDLEQRLFFLEQLAAQSDYQLQQLKLQIQGLGQQQRQGGAGWGGGSGGGGGGYFSCTISAGLAHQSSLPSGQAIHTMPGGAAAPTGVIYNDGPTVANDITSGKQVILAANPDGSYTVIGVYC